VPKIEDFFEHIEKEHKSIKRVSYDADMEKFYGDGLVIGEVIA